MDPDRWRQIRELYQEALGHRPEERRACLDRACPGDDRLRREVEALLGHGEANTEFLEPPPMEVQVRVLDDTPTGSGVVGRQPAEPPDALPGYRLVRELHRGGQGVVYLAYQESTRRKVAIKVMREGPFAGVADRARFEREVQILGQLKHPNIVAIHDSGEAGGHFYFVMDYIGGQPLDAYLRDRQHSIEETLRLFARICDAVNSAHLRGVIHRDLKPGNILINGHGEPYILDFGLAKVPAEEQEAALITLTGQFMGSLPWSSPEQAEGKPGKIDIRTDVYSLGVVLYHMLTGRFPYEVAGNMRDVLDRIMQAEPARPSTFRRQIDNEVETIVLKCLAKERDRRYQTAGELARDVRHYLSGEPIQAKRDSAGYILRKQLRRHRVAIGVAVCFLVLIVSAAMALGVLYARAEAARASAEQARDAESRHRALADQRYEEIIQLADVKRLADARAAADELWPAHPAKIEAMSRWLAEQAAPLRDNLPRHRANLEALRRQAREHDAELSGQRGTVPQRAARCEAASTIDSPPRLSSPAADPAAADPEVGRSVDPSPEGTSEKPWPDAGADDRARPEGMEKFEQPSVEPEQGLAETRRPGDARRTWTYADDATQWRHDTLAGLVEDLEAFVDPDASRGLIAEVEERLESARTIERRSVTGPEATTRWGQAITEIARLEVYGGLRLRPQLGLLPLRRDSYSGLWEFWHMQSGAEPERNPDDQAVNPWLLTADTGLVFVLLPGGTFWMGAQQEDPEGRHHDSHAEQDESPVHRVTIGPFFLSKYEMTQSQWFQIAGHNPSGCRPGSVWTSPTPPDAPIVQVRPWNPVEQVAWLECPRILARLALTLPTEAQWEYAARAGTQTAWWTGDGKASIGVRAGGNLADGWVESRGGPRGWVYEAGLEDRWVMHAPVGTFSPNGFGLHDVIGNVWEWCLDAYAGYDRGVEPDTGLRITDGVQERVARGGSFRSCAAVARSANRGSFAPQRRANNLGVRPARPVVE